MASKRDAARLDVQTHLLSVNGVRIDGLSVPVAGAGAGSFANDPFDRLGGRAANGATYEYNVAAVAGRGDAALTRAFLRARRPITAGDELFLDYGDGRDVAIDGLGAAGGGAASERRGGDARGAALPPARRADGAASTEAGQADSSAGRAAARVGGRERRPLRF